SSQTDSTAMLPSALRRLIRLLSGGDQWTAQVIRGWLWRYRYFLLLAILCNLGAALFEGTTIGVLTLAAESALGTAQGAPGGVSAYAIGFMQPWLDRFGAAAFFFALLALAALMQIVRSLLEFGGQVSMAYMRSWLEGDTKRRLFERFVTMRYAQAAARRTGDLISYIQHVANAGFAVTNVSLLLNHLSIIAGYVLLLLWLSWRMTLVTALALALISVALGALRSRIKRVSRRFLTVSVAFNERVVEYLQGLRLLHTFGRETYAMRSLDAMLNDSIRAQRQGTIWSASVLPIMQIVTVVGVVALLAAGYLMAQQNSAISLARLITFTFVLYRMLPRILNANAAFANLNNDLPFVERIALALKPDDDAEAMPSGAPFSGLQTAIEFEDVSLAYDPLAGNAVQDLSFTLRHGAMTAFVGPSGAGKSTVVNLLLRLYEPTGGRILVDGIALDSLDAASWRERIGVVDQDPFLLNDTVAENIRFGKLDASPEEIVAAAKIANAHEFIVALPHGYDSTVGDRGVSLSGGQRQRIAIARAVVRNPDILIFDEATSALDSLSERRIQEALEQLRGERCVVVIAHRLSTVVNADCIVVLSDGRVRETGAHHELLAKGGIYASLWTLQADAARP
ncbi:MAG: ABC transporter ATP-binding protein, partial [Chloroflexota bacterium]|nr:ABC transporter ATP-binding protein [Chloroflexota bacterium]